MVESACSFRTETQCRGNNGQHVTLLFKKFYIFVPIKYKIFDTFDFVLIGRVYLVA